MTEKSHRFGVNCVICGKKKEPENRDHAYCQKCYEKYLAYSPYKAVSKK